MPEPDCCTLPPGGRKSMPNLTPQKRNDMKRKEKNIPISTPTLIFSTSLTLLLLFLESPNHFCRIFSLIHGSWDSNWYNSCFVIICHMWAWCLYLAYEYKNFLPRCHSTLKKKKKESSQKCLVCRGIKQAQKFLNTCQNRLYTRSWIFSFLSSYFMEIYLNFISKLSQFY